jgi:3-oxoacyl-ACP reductase-like protein
VGSSEKLIKEPWLPDVVIPFGAIGETADATNMGPRSLAMFRVLVLGVERLVARVAQLRGR